MRNILIFFSEIKIRANRFSDAGGTNMNEREQTEPIVDFPGTEIIRQTFGKTQNDNGTQLQM